MTELTFLIELLLNHELPKPTKDLIATRIKEVEEKLVKPANIQYNNSLLAAPQSPSTLALMAKHETSIPSQATATVVEQHLIAQTPAAAAAIEHRNQIMAGQKQHNSLTGRPRKF